MGHGADNGHGGFRGGEVDHKANGFDPHVLVRDFDYGTTSRLPGRPHAARVDARGGRAGHRDRARRHVPRPGATTAAFRGPTLRATEGDRLRIRFINGSDHPHSIHFHGIHPAAMDGIDPIAPGKEFVYEFDAAPFGLHLYHCHVRPLASHISKGLYGTFIIDPKQPREKADELLMVMNGFDTNFDAANEVYAANTIGFAYAERPIQIKRNELVRIYLVNVLEFDLINSFHLHGNLFDYIPTGTSKTAKRADRHRDALPGPARDHRAALPERRQVHVPRPPVGVHRARLDGLLRGQ